MMTERIKPRVAIIVLTWNQRDLTMDCLASLEALDYPADRVHTIVVDNGSVDDTVEAIEACYPSATVLRNAENLGFVGGNNVGIRRALGEKPDYVMLLNNDTVVDPSMLSELLSVIEAEPSVGAVGPKMLYYDQPDVIWCAGNRVDWRTGDTVRLEAGQLDTALDQSPRDVEFVTACALCLRREVIEQIGLLDPRFFIYYEETDWCMRVREAGWRIFYVPRARLWHKVSAAMGTTSPATEYYMARNVLLFLAKHQRGARRLRALALAVGHSLRVAAAYSLKSHDGRRLPNRNARLLAVRDAALGRWGKMGSDVAVVCYPDGR